MNYTLNDLKQLTIKQYDECRESALVRVTKRIGNKPTREQFQRELGRLWSELDIIALVVFIAALAVSSIHIITHMGHLADAAYLTAIKSSEVVIEGVPPVIPDSINTAGMVISRDLFVISHQIALIFLAEGSMILFLVMFGMSEKDWRRLVYLALALLAGMFVLVANWQSGIGPLESLLAPAFTIGIGLKLEHLIVQVIQRKAEVDSRYLAAMAVYEAATQDPATHPDFKKLLWTEIWQKLVSLKANADFADAPVGFKQAAVKRELQKDQWADQEAAPVTEFSPLEEVSSKPTDSPFGSTAHTQAVPVSMTMIPHANGRGGESIGQN